MLLTDSGEWGQQGIVNQFWKQRNTKQMSNTVHSAVSIFCNQLNPHQGLGKYASGTHDEHEYIKNFVLEYKFSSVHPDMYNKTQ